MRSLRARLTLSYTILLATVLVVVVLVVTRLALGFFVRPMVENAAVAAETARQIVLRHPHDAPADIERLIIESVQGPGVVAFVVRPRRPPPRDHMLIENILLHADKPHIIPIGNHEMLIAADLRLLESAVSDYLGALAICVVLAVAISWLIARWITAQAIAPLITVTRELERFAQGDFTPRPVTARHRDELGALGMAYNGAAQQVASAFEERMHVEDHMRRFVAEAGHELRTPLTVIGGYLDILKKSDAGDLVLRERALATLAIENRRMRMLVERLITLAKLEHPQPAEIVPVDVVRAAEDAITTVTRARGGSVVLHGDVDADVLADPAELHEAIGNLVDNALKYGDESPVVVDVEPDAGRVVVRVRNGGPGISAHDRAHIFERFFRGESRGETEGSGLGLAIVERAAARCGGSVRLESAEPGNTVFALVLRGFAAAQPYARRAAGSI